MAMHLILKYNEDIFANGGKNENTVSEHRKVLKEKGSVIWGIIKPRTDSPGVSASREELLKQQISDRVSTYAFLAKAGNITHRCRVLNIYSRNELLDKIEKIPEYCRNELDRCVLGVELRSIVKVGSSVVRHLKRYDVGGIPAIGNPTNPLYVKWKNYFEGNELSDIFPPQRSCYDEILTPLADNQDFYFISKWHEVHETYCAARLYVMKAFEDDGTYWLKAIHDNDQIKIDYMTRRQLYEPALIYYNILVDLTWTWCYVSAEFSRTKKDNKGKSLGREEIISLRPIEETFDLLREMEKGVLPPTDPDSPFMYLKKMRPEFSEAIDIIFDFWKKFCNSNIRSLYNYIKHRGKPLYPGIFIEPPDELYIGDIKYPTSHKDVRRIIDLDKGLDELIEFDNEQLFPYVKNLLTTLKKAVNPSPRALV